MDEVNHDGGELSDIPGLDEPVDQPAEPAPDDEPLAFPGDTDETSAESDDTEEASGDAPQY